MLSGKKEEQCGKILYNDVWFSPNISLMIKYGMKCWARQVAHKESGETVSWFWFGNMQKKGGFENQGIDGRLIDLKEIG